jgi:uncharacterized protein
MSFSSNPAEADLGVPQPLPFPMSRLLRFVGIISGTILAASCFVGATWAHFSGTAAWGWQFALTVLALGFVPLMLAGWRIDHPLLRFPTAAAATSVGLLSFLFFGAIASWAAAGLVGATALPLPLRTIGQGCFGVAAIVALFGVINASWIRVTRFRVELPELPDAWVGRTAAVVTDLHLGNVRRGPFVRRVVRRLNALSPDIVFLSGDLFDGTRLDPSQAIAALTGLRIPLGTYFVTGNHDERFSRPAIFEAVRRVGVRILDNEAVSVDGVRVIGIHDEEASDPELLARLLEQAGVKRADPSILVTHQPVNLAVAEAAGVGLQVSGHTHGGQFWPWNLIVARIWGRFGYGLNRVGAMWVVTSSGVGTWGPPLRVGTRSEVVLVTFDKAPLSASGS